MSYSKTQTNINVPCQVTISADGSVKITTVDAQKYSLSTADAEFIGFLRDDILNTFVVGDEENQGILRLSVSIDTSKESAFRDSLLTQLQIANKKTVVGGANTFDLSANDLETYLANWAAERLMAELTANGVASALEGSELEDLQFDDFAEDLSGGAADMYNGLVRLTPAVRAVIATQIPNKKYMSYVDVSGNGGAAETFSPHLPMEAGDTMTFQFVITQNYGVTESAHRVGASTEDNAAIASGTISGVAPLIGNYTVPARTVNIILVRADPCDLHGLTDVSDNDALISAEYDASNNVTNKDASYNDATTAAQAAFVSWKAANDAIVAFEDASRNLIVAETLLENAILAQTQALFDCSGDVAGPLYDAAQAAIAKVADVSGRVGELQVTLLDLSGDMFDVSSNPTAERSARAGALGSANGLVTSTFAELVTLQAALATARAALDDGRDNSKYKNELYDATLEAAMDASASTASVYEHAHTAYLDASSGLTTLNNTVQSTYDADVSANLVLVDASNNYDVSSNAEFGALFAAAQSDKAEKAAAYAAAAAAAEAVRVYVNTLITAANTAGSAANIAAQVATGVDCSATVDGHTPVSPIAAYDPTVAPIALV